MRRPSTVSSAHFVRYSCARWIGLRVWKPTTRFQPRSAKSARVSAGILVQLRELGLEPLEDGDRAGEVRVLLRVEPRDAGMLAVRRPEALLRLALLVVGVDLLDVEHGEPSAALVGERHPVALRRLGDGQADGQRPAQAVRELHRLDDALVVLAAHEAGERGERAGGEHVEVGELARRERDDLERVDVVGARARPLDEHAAVRPIRWSVVTALTRAPRRRRARAPRAAGRRSARSPRGSAPPCRRRSPGSPAPRTGRRRR